jgi:Family of unknown function (DUF6262)
MPPDPTPLEAAARRKSEEARARAGKALRELDQQGRPITFQAVARQASVSRQWLYQQPELRTEIERLRAVQRDRASLLPATERSTEASLRQRVQTLLDENRRLRQELDELRHELALAYGRQREFGSRASTGTTAGATGGVGGD